MSSTPLLKARCLTDKHGLLILAKTVWKTPNSLPPTYCLIDKKYYVPPKNSEYLFSHPTLNSVMVKLVNKKYIQHHSKSTPHNKELKCLYILSEVTLQLFFSLGELTAMPEWLNTTTWITGNSLILLVICYKIRSTSSRTSSLKARWLPDLPCKCH